MRLTSPQNPRIKSVVLLQKARERNARRVFAVEGAREIERALRSGYELVELYHCPTVLSPAAEALMRGILKDEAAERFEVTDSVFDKMAVREGSDGLVAVIKQKQHALSDLKLPAVPLLLAVEGVEKPGNLGALLRSADGAGIDAVVLLDDSVDVYNPNVVRSSLGAVFHVPVAVATAVAFKSFCTSNHLTICAAALDERSRCYTDASFIAPTVILLGSEKSGLSSYWLDQADRFIQIPMLGIADSLNVATAGAILAYEARRQRERV